MEAADCAPQFRDFKWLPETAKSLVAASLSPKDAVSLALTCKDLRDVARPFTTREFSCNACRARLFSPRALLLRAPRAALSSPSDSAPPAPAASAPPAPGLAVLLLLDDGAAVCVREEEMGDGVLSLHSNVPFIAVPRISSQRAAAHLMDAQTLHCAHCRLFLGIRILTVFPRLGASPSPPPTASRSPSPSSEAALVSSSAAAAAGGQQRQGLYVAEGRVFLVRKYLDLVCPGGFDALTWAAPLPVSVLGGAAAAVPTQVPVPAAAEANDAATPAAAAAAAAAATSVAGIGEEEGRVQVYAECLSGEGGGRRAVLCSGRRGQLRGAGDSKAACLNPLFHSHQVLSARHCWDAGGGTEIAVYCNALHQGAFLLSPPRTEELAQGAMEVADVSCSRCHAAIGWKFCSLGGHGSDLRNLNQVGRFGIVLSSIHQGKEFLPAWRAGSAWEDSEEESSEEEEEEEDEFDENGEIGTAGRGDGLDEGGIEEDSGGSSSSNTENSSSSDGSSSSSSSSGGSGGRRERQRRERSVWSVRALSRICRYHPAV